MVFGGEEEILPPTRSSGSSNISLSRADELDFGTQVMEIRNQLVTMTNSDNSGPEIRRLEAEVESLKAYKVGQCLTAFID